MFLLYIVNTVLGEKVFFEGFNISAVANVLPPLFFSLLYSAFHSIITMDLTRSAHME